MTSETRRERVEQAKERAVDVLNECGEYAYACGYLLSSLQHLATGDHREQPSAYAEQAFDDLAAELKRWTEALEARRVAG